MRTPSSLIKNLDHSYERWVKCTNLNIMANGSLMPPTVKLLTQPVTLTVGKKVKLQANYTYGTSLDKAAFQILC